jgi:hypothetical protein
MDAYQRRQLRTSTILAEEAAVNFEREKNDLLFNPDYGYFNRRGREAYDGRLDINQQLQDLQDRYSGGLKDETARGLFQRNANSQITAARRDVARHSANEYKTWESQVVAARVENALENASLYWDDPNELGKALTLGRESVVDAGLLQGKDPLVIAEDIQTYASQFAANIIERATSVSASAGQKALGDYGSMLEGDAIVQIQAKLDRQLEVEKNENIASLAVSQANDLMQQFGDEPNARNLIMDAVTEIEDEELQDRTLQETMYRLNLRQQANNERRANAYQQAELYVMDPEKGGIEEWIAQNPTAWEDFDAGQRAALKKGPTLQTDWQLWSEISLMSLEEQAQLDPSEYMPYLANPEKQKLLNIITAARQGNDEESYFDRTLNSQLNPLLEELYGEVDKRSDEDRERITNLYQTLNTEAKMRERAKGSELSSDELSILINEIVGQQTLDSGLWFGIGDQQVDVTDVPLGTYRRLSEELRARGKAVTRESILNAYAQAGGFGERFTGGLSTGGGSRQQERRNRNNENR